MNLVDQIEATRQALYEAGLHFGYTAQETLTLSYELDQLINQLYKEKSEETSNE